MTARKIDLHNVVDTDWIKQSFMMDASNMSAQDLQFRTLTTASYSFADTTPGGNEAINPPPQFTRYADIRVGGAGEFQAEGTYRPSESHGIGRFYYEAFTEPTTHLYLRFGVPQYNSLTNFFTNFYSEEMSAMARTGRGTSAFYSIGKVVGSIVGIVPRTLIYMYNVGKWFAGRPSSKYYYMKPTMVSYWNAVTTIMNTLATNMGIIPPVLGVTQKLASEVLNDSADTASGDYAFTSNQINTAMHQMLPEIFNPSGGIDAYALATRYQRLNMAYRKAGYEAIANATVNDAQSNSPNGTNIQALQAALASFMTQKITSDPSVQTSMAAMGANGSAGGQVMTGLTAYTAAYMKCTNVSNMESDLNAAYVDNTPADQSSSGGSSSSGSSSDNSSQTPAAPSTSTSLSAETIIAPTDPTGTGYDTSYFGDFIDFLKAEFESGSAFVSFRVDGSGSIQESFSNSVKESEIQNKINSMSASNRDSRFTFEQGNITGGVIGGIVSGAVGAVRDFMTGTLMGAGINITGLAALAGSAFVDIPKTWDASSANLPTMDFTLQLRSPYGNKLSRLLNLYLPLSMILAGALPLATGKQSYTSPFLCEAYCRGRIATRLGMITNLSITRGVGNVPWTEDGEPLGIDVSFSITDMSSVMFMPVAANFSMGDALKMGMVDLVASAVGNTGAAQVANAVNTAAGGSPNAASQNITAAGQAIGASLTSSMWDDDNAFTDYMAVLGSLTMVDQVSPLRKWKLRVTNQVANFNTWKSPAHMAMMMGATWPGRVITTFSQAPRVGQAGA